MVKHCAILFLTSLLVLLWTLLVPDGSKENIQFLGGVGIFTLVFSLYSWIKLGNELLSPYAIFLVVLYVFSYGVPMLYAFGIVPEDDIVGYLGITYQRFYDSCGISLIMLCFFHVGALTAHSRCKKKALHDAASHTNDKVKNLLYAKRLNKIAKVIALLSGYFYIQDVFSTMTYAMLYGYGAIYEREGGGVLSSLSSFIGSMFIPSIICLFVANRNNKIYTTTITSILILVIFAGFMIGGRGESVTLMALLLILYNSLVRKFSRKAYIIVAVAALFLFPILTFVANTRDGTDRTFSLEMTGSESNPIVSAISEMGGSQSCLIKTMEFVPNQEPFRYGKSYVYSFATIVPNLGFWKVHPAVKEAGLSKWLTNRLGLPYGTGFSMFAEAYINFGYMGFLIIYFLGYIFAYLFGMLRISIRRGDLVTVAVILICFKEALGLPRGQMINIVRQFYYIILPLIFYCKRSIRF